MSQRLTESEIDRAVARIRGEYDHYIVHFLKTPDAKKKFEERYAEALRSRLDLANFLNAEIQVVKTLIDRAKEKSDEPKTGPKPARKVVSYADRIVEQLRARIKDYPALGLPDHPEKSPDVDKLYGTLRWYRREIWEVLYPLFLAKCPSPGLFLADTELGALTLQGDKWPKEVDSYWALLNGKAELSQIARAQNRCLQLGAQSIHRMIILLDIALKTDTMTKQELDIIRKADAFCKRVLNDFRLNTIGRI